MTDHWAHGGYAHPLPGYRPRCRPPVKSPAKSVKAPTRYSTGVNAYCTTPLNSTCNDPQNYDVARGTWFVRNEVPHELPTPSYPLFRQPNAIYTPKPSYLNVVANDPDHPFHYMGLTDGSIF
jgi:hypothetical protein